MMIHFDLIIYCLMRNLSEQKLIFHSQMSALLLILFKPMFEAIPNYTIF